jgi:leucyl/phenylalanyl-tRNA--protein transferase
VSRSLRRTLRRSGWTTTVDAAFGEVVAACAARASDGTWITASMARAYQRLHELGWAHSLEVWAGGRLIGGLYGVQAGGVFTGESMFHRLPDASKVAMLDLAVRLGEAGGTLFDVQVATPHLCSMGPSRWPARTSSRSSRRCVTTRCGCGPARSRSPVSTRERSTPRTTAPASGGSRPSGRPVGVVAADVSGTLSRRGRRVRPILATRAPSPAHPPPPGSGPAPRCCQAPNPLGEVAWHRPRRDRPQP